MLRHIQFPARPNWASLKRSRGASHHWQENWQNACSNPHFPCSLASVPLPLFHYPSGNVQLSSLGNVVTLLGHVQVDKERLRQWIQGRPKVFHHLVLHTVALRRQDKWTTEKGEMFLHGTELQCSLSMRLACCLLSNTSPTTHLSSPNTTQIVEAVYMGY